jgi:hypothetical protein
LTPQHPAPFRVLASGRQIQQPGKRGKNRGRTARFTPQQVADSVRAPLLSSGSLSPELPLFEIQACARTSWCGWMGVRSRVIDAILPCHCATVFATNAVASGFSRCGMVFLPPGTFSASCSSRATTALSPGNQASAPAGWSLKFRNAAYQCSAHPEQRASIDSSGLYGRKGSGLLALVLYRCTQNPAVEGWKERQVHSSSTAPPKTGRPPREV